MSAFVYNMLTAMRQLLIYVNQEGLAVASIARDDPSIGGGHVCWGSYDGFNFARWGSRCVPGMHCDPMHFRHRQTDTDIVA